MSYTAPAGRWPRLRARADVWRAAPVQAGVTAPDVRRLQLVLAGLWLLDGVLQLQSVMFTRQFPAMLAESAAGQPGVVAGPVNWAVRLIAGHPGPANAAFAGLQLTLGLGLAWRPTVRPALAASVAWGLAVWWLGEGLGGLLTGAASPVTGAPGAALLYAVAAVLLWPARRDTVDWRRGAGPAGESAGRGRSISYVAEQAIGARAAASVWLVLWGGLAALAVQPAVRAPHAFGGLLAGMADGEPVWLARLDQQASAAAGGHGLAASVVLAVLLAAIAVAGCRPDRAPGAARAAVAAAVVFCAVTTLAGGFGELFTGMATDPGTGPILALVALAYWPRRPGSPVVEGSS